MVGPEASSSRRSQPMQTQHSSLGPTRNAQTAASRAPRSGEREKEVTPPKKNATYLLPCGCAIPSERASRSIEKRKAQVYNLKLQSTKQKYFQCRPNLY